MLPRALFCGRLIRLECFTIQSAYAGLVGFPSSVVKSSAELTDQRFSSSCTGSRRASDGFLLKGETFFGFSNRLQSADISASSRSPKNFRIRMDEEEKKKRMAEIEKMQQEKKPVGGFALLKYYVKRYWYIAIPVHVLSCLAWLLVVYLTVKSGVDIVAVLEYLHIPNSLVEKVKNTPPGAGVAVIVFIVYKIISPLRYATTLAGIKLTFSTLRKMGKLKTAKEVTYKMRAEFERRADKLNNRYSRYSKFGVRSLKKRTSGTNGKKP